MGRYQETYRYDPAGNILAVRHAGSDAAHPGWTRTYTYGPGNRLAETVTGAGPAQAYTYDAHGSTTSMPHLPLMVWDHADRLRATATQVVADRQPETTWYAYDGGGQRARWVTLRSTAPGEQPARKCERIYAGGFEVYREYDETGSAVTLERLSLSVMDGTKRIALAERRTTGDDRSPELLVCYQFGNHLGSAALELDAAGQVISYEEYHPYGSTSYQAVDKSLRAAAKRYRFTGLERDESTGLEYHGARYYAPWLGRWTAPDPAQRDHAYCYSFNRPSVLVDLDGNYPTLSDPAVWTALRQVGNAVDTALQGAGAVAQYASDMMLVPSLLDMAGVSPLDRVPSTSFQQGRQTGRTASMAVATVEMAIGTGTLMASAGTELAGIATGAGGGTPGGPLGVAGGGTLGGTIALAAAMPMAVAGGTMVGHGGAVLGLDAASGRPGPYVLANRGKGTGAPPSGPGASAAGKPPASPPAPPPAPSPTPHPSLPVTLDPLTGTPVKLGPGPTIGPAYPTWDEAKAAAHPTAHIAQVEIQVGGEKLSWWEVSEIGAGEGHGQKFGDTEQKALARLDKDRITAGTKVTITGTWAPCHLGGAGGCFGSMEEAATELGIEIEYQPVTKSGKAQKPYWFSPK